MSDNGPQFTATNFAEYCKNKGIKHSRTPPFHPASNGAAERSVQVADHLLPAADSTQDNHELQQPDSLYVPEADVAIYESTNEDVEGVNQPVSVGAPLRRSSRNTQPPKRLIEVMEEH